jgi:GNAT superfamily N-acetyltransferase
VSAPPRPASPRPGAAPSAAIRPATTADLRAITAIAVATGQDEDFENDYPAYLRHLIGDGVLLVCEAAGSVIGFGATLRIGSGAEAISMLTDLFVDPAAHGRGVGRAILTELWGGESRRMTFASLHPNALPLYTSFGVSAWWPLLYLSGPVERVPETPRWSVRAVTPELAADLDRTWTGADRTSDYRMWAARADGAAIIAGRASRNGPPGRNGRPLAVGVIGGPAGNFGITHLAMAGSAEGTDAANAVLAVLRSLEAPAGIGRVCLPGPHPAVRPLLAAGWRITGLDLHLSSEPDLIDPLRAVPSPSMA